MAYLKSYRTRGFSNIDLLERSFSLVIIYFIITIVSLYFVISAIVHARSTHVIAIKMEKQFEHYFHEDAHQNDRSS